MNFEEKLDNWMNFKEMFDNCVLDISLIWTIKIIWLVALLARSFIEKLSWPYITRNSPTLATPTFAPWSGLGCGSGRSDGCVRDVLFSFCLCFVRIRLVFVRICSGFCPSLVRLSPDLLYLIRRSLVTHLWCLMVQFRFAIVGMKLLRMRGFLC